MQADPSNQFVFVPHIAENGGANAIFQFRFDDTTGQLTANSPEKVVPSTLDGPRHFCFHPSRALIYCSNEQSSSVTVYAFDVTAGTLRDLQKLSTLPADFNPENTCSQIQITPDGRFLYAPNRGHDSIAIFTVDETSGLLKVVGHQPTEREPRAFSVDGDGHYLYAAGLETGKLASYRIEPATGALQPMAVYPVGDVAMWVLAR